LRIDPTLAGAHLGLSQIFFRRGATATAREQAVAELQLRSTHDQVLLELGNLLMDLNEFVLAANCLRLLVNSKPESITGWINLAVAQFAVGLYLEGIESSLCALKLDPANEMAMFNIALGYEHLGNYSTALAWIGQARHNPNLDVSYQRLELRLRAFCAASMVGDWVKRIFGLVRGSH
jgi:tetratricopeptide (TPR) repeat protein